DVGGNGHDRRWRVLCRRENLFLDLPFGILIGDCHRGDRDMLIPLLRRGIWSTARLRAFCFGFFLFWIVDIDAAVSEKALRLGECLQLAVGMLEAIGAALGVEGFP